MSGVRGINQSGKPFKIPKRDDERVQAKVNRMWLAKGNKGSATVEAAIVLPIFLMVILTFAYILRVFYAYNTVQTSLTEVARRIGNMSYFYYASGLKDYSDKLNNNAQAAGETLNEQKNTLVNAFTSFNDMVSGVGSAANGNLKSFDDLQKLIETGTGAGQNAVDAYKLVQSVIKDPKAEFKLVTTLLAQELNYRATNFLLGLIAKGDIEGELTRRVNAGEKDPASALGIKDGVKGLDFSDSSAFGDTETLEFVVRYSIKPPIPFGLMPELKLTNRVKIIAWTGGRGESVKVSQTDSQDEATTGASVWAQMDTDKRYWDRGLEIEDLEAAKIVNDATGRGLSTVTTPKNYPVIDAYAYNSQDQSLEYYDVFTLNPFLNTYETRPNMKAYEIKRHGLRLMECDRPIGISEAQVKVIKRVVVVVVPENVKDLSFVDKAKEELSGMGIEVRLIKGYGAYQEAPEVKEQQTEQMQSGATQADEMQCWNEKAMAEKTQFHSEKVQETVRNKEQKLQAKSKRIQERECLPKAS
ncbi:MAG: pilus assembly protein [Clostridia bacterium]|nr:pilus assembly protein [Clostridia bacterium]